MSQQITPIETIRRFNPTRSKFCFSRDFAKVLVCAEYRDSRSMIESARFGWSRNVLLNQIKSGAYERAVTDVCSCVREMVIPLRPTETHRPHPARRVHRLHSRHVKKHQDNTLISGPDYHDFIEALKARVTSARITAARAITHEAILLYWDIGQGIVENKNQPHRRRRLPTPINTARQSQRKTPHRQTTRAACPAGNGGWEVNANSKHHPLHVSF